MMEVGSIDLGMLLKRVAGEARTEATLQSEIHTLLLAADLNLDDADLENTTLESQTGAQRRIDIEVGHVCVEVKKRLRPGPTLDQAVDQLGAYVLERTESLGQRYVGVLTDGAEWRLYHHAAGRMLLVSSHRIDPATPDVGRFIAWLAAVLATEERVAPTAAAIASRLGATSAGHELELADLRALYEANRDRPEIVIKRELWGKLLTTALGTQFRADDHELFVEHTLLVATAETVAHAVLGFDIKELDAAALLGGDLFSRRALILGVVEHDFFDWPLDCGESGHRWVLAIARRLAQFDWSATQHDAMKTIYESVITAATRKTLGEYYTPDFLAEHMVSETVTDPLNARVLDPSCGSGTFVFHAVRRYLDAADAAGHDNATALRGLVTHVAGIDLHPVAVTLARVTYLLAIGSERLQAPDRPALRVPIYIGDSIQWGQRRDLFASETLNVDTDDGAQMFADQLRFPHSLLDDADRFDQLVAEVADASTNRPRGSSHPAVGPIARRHGLSGQDLDTLTTTFATMCRLHDEGRNHIWGYFVRNLARPAWFARPANRVNVLIGNPPWLSFRFMTAAMQERFRAMASTRGLWAGGSLATQQDLSDLFVVRAIEQFLQEGGRFNFVMPAAALTRGQYHGFRQGIWPTDDGTVAVSFVPAWDLSMVYPYFFPRTCAVVGGERKASPAETRPLGADVISWSGSISNVHSPWSTVEVQLTQVARRLERKGRDGQTSPYKDRFTNGATVFPRVLTTVVRDETSPVGTGAGRMAVRSARGTYEKLPWKSLDDLHGVIEEQFLYPLLLGECVLPYRQLEAPLAVLPVTSAGRLVEPSESPGLSEWWSRASQHWDAHRSSAMTLTQNIDYRRKLTQQFPLAPHRVVVAHSAMHVAACRVTSPSAVVEHQLDWAAVRSAQEGLFLCGLLNSPTVTQIATPHMTSGKGGGRHLGKSLWNVPVPLFDPDDPLHATLVELAGAAEEIVLRMELPRAVHGTLRRFIRHQLATSQLGRRIDQLTAEILGVPVVDASADTPQ